MPIRLPDLPAANLLAPSDLMYGVVGGNSRRIPFSALTKGNLITNGQGRVNQRGYVSGTATTIANQFTLDRWRVVVSGQNLVFTGDSNRRVMTAPAGGVEQTIPAGDVVGGTYAINWTGTATCTVNGVIRTKGASFTLPAATNAVVRFSGGTFSDVMLVEGTVVPPYLWQPFGAELANCQRFCVRMQGLASANGFSAIGSGHVASVTTDVNIVIPLPVTPRVPPVFSFAGNITVLDGSSGSNLVSIVNSLQGTGGSVWLTARLAAALTAGRGCVMYTQNAVTNWFQVEMEVI